MFRTIEKLADLSVLRGCVFVIVGILAMMLRLTADPGAALSTGGEMALAFSLMLCLSAVWMPRVRYAATPVWTMLKANERPSPMFAQRVIGECMRAACLKYALHSATAAAGLLGTSIALPFVGSLV